MHLNKLMKTVIEVCMCLFILLLPRVNAVSFAGYSPKLQDKLSNYTIIQVDKNIDTLSMYENMPSDVVGLTDYDNHKIIIRTTKDEWRNQHLLDHEAGHVFDTWDIKYTDQKSRDLPYFYSNSNEFCSLYEKEKDSIESYSQDIDTGNSRGEYFAECFAWYLEDPEKLKSSSPLTYEFIDKVYTLNYK